MQDCKGLSNLLVYISVKFFGTFELCRRILTQFMFYQLAAEQHTDI